MNEMFLCDQAGNKVPPDPSMADAVLASGQTVATGTAGDDKTFTVTAGKTYALIGIDTAVLISLTGVTSTAANIERVAPINKIVIIKIPVGVTTIYLEGTVDTKNVHLWELSVL